MKKIGLKILVAVFTFGIMVGCFAGCAKREETLKIYNWGEYIDPTVISEFQEWYARPENGGKEITVKYKTFEANEDVLTSLNKGDDWDVVCPSDYMIERMIQKDMLHKLDADVVEEFNTIGNPLMKELVSPWSEYCVPYIWGTFGIMYDTQRVKGAEVDKLHSWAALWDSAFNGKIYMKNQVRDSYTVAMLYARKDALQAAINEHGYDSKEYQDILKDIFQNFSQAKLDEAEAALKAQKGLLKKYESDEGKMEMAAGGSNSGSLGMYWSCDAGFAMNDYEEEPSFFSCNGEPTVIEGNKNLGYIVPDEGSNVWVDGWVIPKNAKNVSAANMFIKFTMQKEIAKLNSEYAGAPSANYEAMQELEEEYEEDDEFFAGSDNPEQFKAMYMEARFPSDETLARCAVMSDFGDLLDAAIEMFQRVKRS